MESILVLTHVDETGAALTKASLEAVGAGHELAARLGAEMKVGIVAEEPQRMRLSLPCAALAVHGEAFAQPRYATDAAACTALCKAAQATLVLAPHSARFARVMAGVAHRVGGAIDTHITAITGADGVQVSRWFYRQRMEATLTRTQRPWFLLLEPGTQAGYAGTGEAAALALIDAAAPEARTTVQGIRAPQQAGGATIRPEAKLLFVAGAGWTKKQADGQVHATEAGEIILRFLRNSGASLGSSKSLVDQGGDGSSVLPFLTHMNQVGQTGATPRHPKGLATCCHGEEPHVVGWRFIGERRAISLDPNCGWSRGKADVVYVADAFAVMAKVNELLESNR